MGTQNIITVGIQGTPGSTNECACEMFAKKQKWGSFNIKYLVSTENVLKALNEGDIDFGTFAKESSGAGLVEETVVATRKYNYEVVDELDIAPNHALFTKGRLDEGGIVYVASHPQALKEHEAFLREKFKEIELIEEVDTGTAVKNLMKGMYPENSVAIAPINCEKVYGGEVYLRDLPANKGYSTKILLCKKAG